MSGGQPAALQTNKDHEDQYLIALIEDSDLSIATSTAEVDFCVEEYAEGHADPNGRQLHAIIDEFGQMATAEREWPAAGAAAAPYAEPCIIAWSAAGAGAALHAE